MKRFISIGILLFFLAGNSYGAFSIHYCGGKVKSVSSATTSKNCSKCGKESANDCCKTVNKLVKSDDFSKTQTQWTSKILVSVAKLIHFDHSASLYLSAKKSNNKFFFTYIPPAKVSAYLLIHALVI